MDRLLCGQVFILDDNKNPLYPQFVAWRATLRMAKKPVAHIRLGVQYNALYEGEPLNEAEMKINIQCVRLHLLGKHAALPQSIRILVCVEFDDTSWGFADITTAKSDDERFLEVLFQIPRLK